MNERLIGSWKLVSAVREELPSGARTDLFGANPQGILNYSPEGRMIALIAHSERKAPTSSKATPAEAQALYGSMLSYAGPYSVEGDVVTHHVDISWNESFTGSKQMRHFMLDGNRLILSTPQSADPIEGKISVRRMTWERV